MAVYLLIQAELSGTAPFPGNSYVLDTIEDVSYPPSMADLSVWATTQEHTKNEAFNSTIGDIFVWRYFFPKLAEYFGTEVSTFSPRGDD